MKSQEEIQSEFEHAKKQAEIDSNRRKILYASAETAILEKEKRFEAIKLLLVLIQKYGISGDDMVLLLDNVPYI